MYDLLDGIDARSQVFDGEAKYAVSNKEMNLAWKLISNTNVSVFLTGKAGTGKTTFLHKLRELTPKRMAVLAPTGVAAINAKGQTIHSFFQLPLGPQIPGMQVDQRKSYRMGQNKKKVIRSLDLLVIDEISMVRCDLLDAIDQELRKYKDRYKPFGGVQLLMIGDLQQLPPVTRDNEWRQLEAYYSTPYFFSSRALEQTKYVTITLKHIYRQQDHTFIDILGKIRNNALDSQSLQVLNSRWQPGFVIPEDSDWIRLVTHNRMADEYNQSKLAGLGTAEKSFRAKVEGSFPESSYPADDVLTLKVGAQVMFLKNDPSGEHQYYNGKIGVVRTFCNDGIVVWCKEDDSNILVTPLPWENTKYVLDEESKEVREEVEGTFTQYPLRLAWAITVHKSQGLTFDHAVLDINQSFAHGQAYVALSRCRSLEGLVLANPLDGRSIITDTTVNAYVVSEETKSEHIEEHLPGMMREYKFALLSELFSFDVLERDLRYLLRIVTEHMARKHEGLMLALAEAVNRLSNDLTVVGKKFLGQLQRIIDGPVTEENRQFFDQRISSGTTYFIDKMQAHLQPLLLLLNVKIDNKQVAKQYGNALESFLMSYKMKSDTMTVVNQDGFSAKNYLDAKAKSLIDDNVKAGVTASKKVPPMPKAAPKAPAKEASPSRLTQNAGSPWTQKEEEQVLALYQSGQSIGDIAQTVGRTYGAIKARLKRKGVL